MLRLYNYKAVLSSLRGTFAGAVPLIEQAHGLALLLRQSSAVPMHYWTDLSSSPLLCGFRLTMSVELLISAFQPMLMVVIDVNEPTS